MAFIEKLEAAFRKPASRWRRFLRDVVIDVFLISISLWFSYALATNSAGSSRFNSFFIEGSVLGVLAVALLFWRGLYSINLRYIGLGEFLNIVFVGSLS